MPRCAATIAAHTIPSRQGSKVSTLASFQKARCMESSLKMTMSPTLSFEFASPEFEPLAACSLKLVKYSFLHRQVN